MVFLGMSAGWYSRCMKIILVFSEGGWTVGGLVGGLVGGRLDALVGLEKDRLDILHKMTS